MKHRASSEERKKVGFSSRASAKEQSRGIVTPIPVMVSVDLVVHHHPLDFLQIPVDLHYTLIFVLSSPCIHSSLLPIHGFIFIPSLGYEVKTCLNGNSVFGNELKQVVNPNPTTEVLPWQLFWVSSHLVCD